MRLAPGLEVGPIGTVGPNGVFRFRLLDELGSPVCDFRQWADFGVRGSVGKDEVGGHQKMRLSLDTVPLSGVRTVLSSGNCQSCFLRFRPILPALVDAAGVDPNACQTAIAKGDTLSVMPKRTTPPKPAPDQVERTHVTRD